MSKRSRAHAFLVYEQKCDKWQKHESDWDGCRRVPRWRQIRRAVFMNRTQWWHKTARKPKRWKNEDE